MKTLCRRGAALAAAAALALALALVPRAGASAALGEPVRRRESRTAPGVTVTEDVLWTAAGSPRAEHYVTYQPGGPVRAAVGFGSYLISRQTLAAMAGTLENQGLRVVGGINASFYDGNGCPIGLVIQNGRLLSANPDFCAVGFKADGSAVIGRPEISLSAAWTTRDRVETDEEGNETPIPGVERTIPLSGFNKVRSAGGYYLTSGAYAPTTKNSLGGVDVVLRPEGGLWDLPLNGELACLVEAVRGSTEDTSIPEGCLILSMNEFSAQEQLAVLSELEPGDAVTLTVTTRGEWGQVDQALSGLYDLVLDGQVNAELPADGRAPRTAVGLRGDGGVVLYTVDGRQNGYSVGATYTEVAQRLVELGCVSAIAMDGGGSTSLGTTYPDGDAFGMLNRGSDGAARSVSTCLFLVQPADCATGVPGGFFLRADSDVLPAGGTTAVSAAMVDTACWSMTWSGEQVWSAQRGRVDPDGSGGWVYTAAEGEENYMDTLTVTGGGMSGSMEVTVVGTPTRITVYDADSGKALTALSLRPGEEARMTASSVYRSCPVADREELYSWSVSPELGQLDAQGRFTAGQLVGTGEITVSFGGASASVPVTVANPFVDVDNHWAKADIDRLYALGIAGGELDGGERRFYPQRSITRGELTAMLVRMLGEDTEQYDGAQLPFADQGEIAQWALPYIRAAYALGLLTGAQEEGALYAHAASSVTREEAMTILGRALGRTEEADLLAFPDGEQVSGWAQPYVRTLVSLGIVQGSDDGSLLPKADVTRGETAKIINAVAALTQEEPGPEPSPEPDPDPDPSLESGPNPSLEPSPQPAPEPLPEPSPVPDAPPSPEEQGQAHQPVPQPEGFR